MQRIISEEEDYRREIIRIVKKIDDLKTLRIIFRFVKVYRTDRGEK